MICDTTQWDRITASVPRWLERVPLYRHRAGNGPGAGGDLDFFQRFRALPIITKREIREGFPKNFLPPGVELEQWLDEDLIELERTSGTSEEPTPLILGRGWWMEQERQALRLNPLVARHLIPGARRVTIVSPVCSGEICYSGIPSFSDRAVGDALFVNLSRHPFFWSDKSLARMAREAVEWNPVFLDLDPVYGVLFALYCEREGIRLPALKFIVSSYEFLSAAHDRILRRVFGVPVLNLYGSTETGHLLMEDENRRMLPSLPTAFLELVDCDSEGVGDLVVTTLSNEFMPLIRYGIGDLARQGTDAPGGSFFELHGRARDALKDREGERITVAAVDKVLADWPGLVHYQLRQPEPNEHTLYFVLERNIPDRQPPAAILARLGELLRIQGGPHCQEADHIPCESSGKFRLCRPGK